MSSSVRLAMPSPLFIFLDSRVFNAARCCSEKCSTRQGNCSIRWEHHGLAYGLPDVTEPAFHLELQLLLGFSEKRYHLPHFCQKLWPPVHLQGFFSRPDLVCVCVIHPTRESISAPPPARIMFFLPHLWPMLGSCLRCSTSCSKIVSKQWRWERAFPH